ncbi:MAG: hypothetical protein JWL61_5552 [Gemmatimonadetes bacterium]|nr:hypothetical protein [Gemmatimonadota bacterium]
MSDEVQRTLIIARPPVGEVVEEVPLGALAPPMSATVAGVPPPLGNTHIARLLHSERRSKCSYGFPVGLQAGVPSSH